MTILKIFIFILALAAGSAFGSRRSPRDRKFATKRVLRRSSGVGLCEESELVEVSDLCVRVFFGEASLNPFKGINLNRLRQEQYIDLSNKLEAGRSSLFKVRSKGKIVGFAEVSLVDNLKYLGEGIQVVPTRPLLSNLAVAEDSRGRGLGTTLVDACEAQAKTWGFSEMVLQVDEANERARRFYQSRGYVDLYCDRAARSYNANGLFLSAVPTARVTMRKILVDPPRSKDISPASWLQGIGRKLFGEAFG